MTTNTRSEVKSKPVGFSHTQNIFNPLTDFDNTVAVYRGDSLTLNGSDVTAWPNRSSAGGDFNLAPVINKPTVLLAELNGKDVVSFNDADSDRLRNIDAGFVLANGMFIYLVMRENNQSTNDVIFDTGNVNQDMMCRTPGASGQLLGLRSGTTSNLTAPTIILNEWFTLGVYWNGAGSFITVNNVVGTPATLSPGDISGTSVGFTLGADANSGNHQGMDVAEVIILSKKPTSSEDNGYHNSYIPSYYGLS